MIKSNKNRKFTEILLLWHDTENLRSMPWKQVKDPYKIWLSEIILQQTRVEQGTGYFLRFVEKYPTVHDLANAASNDVFKLWEGLGYYSRCKNLIETARFISTDLKGVFPNSYENILKLKGVGPYTAAAIASFAFDAQYAVVDGNVNRVLARFFGIYTPIDSTYGKAEMTTLANKLLPKGASALFNQAIMDFGATVCKPKQPLCVTCVFNNNCVALKEDKVNLLPIKTKSLVKKSRWFYYVIMQHRDTFFIQKRTAKDIWQSLYEFILIEKYGFEEIESILTSPELNPYRSKQFKIISISEPIKQQLTHQTIYSIFVHIRTDKISNEISGEWVTIPQLKKRPFPRTITGFLQHFIVDKNGED